MINYPLGCRNRTHNHRVNSHILWRWATTASHSLIKNTLSLGPSYKILNWAYQKESLLNSTISNSTWPQKNNDHHQARSLLLQRRSRAEGCWYGDRRGRGVLIFVRRCEISTMCAMWIWVIVVLIHIGGEIFFLFWNLCVSF